MNIHTLLLIISFGMNIADASNVVFLYPNFKNTEQKDIFDNQVIIAHQLRRHSA